MTMETQATTQTPTESNSMNNEDIAHLAGVFDAVGNVTIRVVKDSDYRIGYTLRPMLRLLRPDDEDPVLGKLIAYCDEQGVRYSITEKSHGADRDDVSIEWTVKDPESVRRFLEPMMDYLVTNLLQADLMLTEVLPAIKDGKHRSKDGFYELMGVADELRSGNSHQGNVKYTQQFFADEWSLTQ